MTRQTVTVNQAFGIFKTEDIAEYLHFYEGLTDRHQRVIYINMRIILTLNASDGMVRQTQNWKIFSKTFIDFSGL